MRSFFTLVLFLFSAHVPCVMAESTPTSCEVFFSPHDGVAERLVALINEEDQSIKAAVYCLMHAGIAKALNAAVERGVDVELIVDPFSIKTRSPIAKMVEKGVPVFVWNPPYQKQGKKSLMHDKFCVFGDHTVWTGSFNFTREGNLSNRENVVLLSGPKIAKKYLTEFNTIKVAGCCAYSAFMETKK